SKIFTPVELERLSGPEGQRNKGATTRGLLVALPIATPVARKGRNPVVGPAEAKRHQLRMHLLQRPPLLARLPGLGLQPARQLLGKGIKLARPLRRRKMWLDRLCVQILLDRIPRQPRAARNLPARPALT